MNQNECRYGEIASYLYASHPMIVASFTHVTIPRDCREAHVTFKMESGFVDNCNLLYLHNIE